MKSDKLPRVMSLEAALVGSEDYWNTQPTLRPNCQRLSCIVDKQMEEENVEEKKGYH